MGKTVLQSADSSQASISNTNGQGPGFVQVVALLDPATGDLAGTPNTTAFVDTFFDALHAFTGASIGDLIVQTDVYDMTTNPPTLVETTWRNATTGLDLAAPPAGADLTYKGGAGLTDAQLRATPVPVYNTPVGLSFWHTAQVAGPVAQLAKTGAGVLGAACINHKGSGTSNITLYDGTDNTGSVIAVLDSSDLLGVQRYDVAFSVGLYIEVTGTTTPDATVTFR